MPENNEAVAPEEPTSGTGNETSGTAAAVPNGDVQGNDLPEWAAGQIQEMGGSEDGEAQEAPQDGTVDSAAGDEDNLPDWAVQKMEQMESGDTADNADEATSGSDEGLPSWAVQKMQEFADQEGTVSNPTPPADVTTTSAPVSPGREVPATPVPDMPAVFKEHAPNLELMLDLPLDVSVELGHAELPLAHVLGLKAGSVVQLDRLPGEPLDLLVNGHLVAQGEIVVLNDTFAFRITDLIED